MMCRTENLRPNLGSDLIERKKKRDGNTWSHMTPNSVAPKFRDHIIPKSVKFERKSERCTQTGAEEGRILRIAPDPARKRDWIRCNSFRCCPKLLLFRRPMSISEV